MGEIYQSLGKLAQAEQYFKNSIQEFNQAIELEQGDAEGYNSRGNSYSSLGGLYQSLGELAQAEQCFKNSIQEFNQAIELDKEFTYAYYHRGTRYISLGEIYQSQGELAQAEQYFKNSIQEFNQAIELDKEFTYAYCNRGNSYLNLGELYQSQGELAQAEQYFKNSIQEFNQAIELDKEFTYAYNNRGNSHANLGILTSALLKKNNYLELAVQDWLRAQHLGNLLGVKNYLILMKDKGIEFQPELALKSLNTLTNLNRFSDWNEIFWDAYLICHPFHSYHQWLALRDEENIQEKLLLKGLLIFWLGDVVQAFLVFRDTILSSYPGNLMAHYYLLSCCPYFLEPEEPHLKRAILSAEHILPPESVQKSWTSRIRGLLGINQSPKSELPRNPREYYYAGMIFLMASDISKAKRCFAFIKDDYLPAYYQLCILNAVVH